MIKITRAMRLTEALIWPDFRPQATENAWVPVFEQVEKKTDIRGNIYTVMYQELKL